MMNVVKIQLGRRAWQLNQAAVLPTLELDVEMSTGLHDMSKLDFMTTKPYGRMY